MDFTLAPYLTASLYGSSAVPTRALRFSVWRDLTVLRYSGAESSPEATSHRNLRTHCWSSSWDTSWKTPSLSADLLLLEIASRAAALILSRPTAARPVRATRQVRSFILCEVRVNSPC